MYPPHCK